MTDYTWQSGMAWGRSDLCFLSQINHPAEAAVREFGEVDG